MADWLTYMTEAKMALDTIKSALSLVPKGKQYDDAKQKLEVAEKAFEASKAELAKGLGFRLCRCEFPPPIMLWDKDKRVNVCPKCGDIYPPKSKIEPLKSGFR